MRKPDTCITLKVFLIWLSRIILNQVFKRNFFQKIIPLSVQTGMTWFLITFSVKIIEFTAFLCSNLAMIHFSFPALEELFQSSVWVLFFNRIYCFILNFLYLHNSENSIYSNVTHLLRSFQGNEVLVVSVAYFTSLGRGWNFWPILQRNVMTPNLENQQQLEIVMMKKARWVFHYKLFPSHS